MNNTVLSIGMLAILTWLPAVNAGFLDEIKAKKKATEVAVTTEATGAGEAKTAEERAEERAAAQRAEEEFAAEERQKFQQAQQRPEYEKKGVYPTNVRTKDTTIGAGEEQVEPGVVQHPASQKVRFKLPIQQQSDQPA
ncbi:hypothetical protein M1466_03620 [Candidatus Dependentiae bacterium]|nr:hypothetical protein [Candidatus Dependentiae bacterium]